MEQARKFIHRGHAQFRRQFAPRYHRNADGQFGNEFLRQADHSVVTLKLGGTHLSETNNSEVGTVSARHTLQPVSNGVIPVHKVILTPSCGPMGVMGIRKKHASDYWPIFQKDTPRQEVLCCSYGG